MAKEVLIRKKAVQILERECWVTWRPPKIKYQQADIFGIFDVICWKKNERKIKFIQLTTLSNLSARRKKIQKFFRKNKISPKIIRNIGIEIWAWNSRDKIFKIEPI